MEDLMWIKSKHSPSANKFPIISSMNSCPWDQEALGAGFIWPPRSYTCTFCRREFRSAQALGGHMNVHRRDRARLLKQSSLAQAAGPILHHQGNSLLGPAAGCLKAPPATFTSLCKELGEPFMNSEEILSFSNLKKTASSTDEEMNTKRLALDEEDDFLETKLSVGKDNMVDPQYGEVICKRYKKSGVSRVPLMPFFQSNLFASSDHHRYSSSSREEIDLELRLGDRSVNY